MLNKEATYCILLYQIKVLQFNLHWSYKFESKDIHEVEILILSSSKL